MWCISTHRMGVYRLTADSGSINVTFSKMYKTKNAWNTDSFFASDLPFAEKAASNAYLRLAELAAKPYEGHANEDPLDP